MQQVESNRRADAAVVEKFRAVDAEVGMRVEVERVRFVVKDPGELPARDPLLEALGYRASNFLSRSSFGHVFKEHSEQAVFLSHGHNGGDRSRDLLFVFRRDGQSIHREDETDELIQKLHVGGRRLQLKRIEPRRFPIADREIAAVQRSDRDFRTAILVEVDGRERMVHIAILLRQGKERIERRRFARARRADDRRVGKRLFVKGVFAGL